MTSSMITGEQRWASKRRGGMTVLGKVAKVAVPKPLNLPSQRLENHGLDPSVEIVPKGTLSWGSRPSSAGSNAWATSTPSPSTEGSSSLPSHLAGRPLSGSGTRPSTAGNDKAHESNNSWGPNSRPSSASGVLGSNHASLTSRPRSADTRPGSSHLSRFAEPSPEGSRAWGATAPSERMGVSEGFSLSSGDFPTLGSEKDESRRSSEPLDEKHGRPDSSSGGVKSMPDSMEIAHDDAREDIKGHSWRKDSLSFVEDGPRPSMDRWHGDPHLYQNPNIGPPHYDSWRGPPSVNPPGAVWYRGPPGPPYGGPVPPGGYHMEPFPYYRPQVPGPVLANSQTIPPPGPGHHGHHPKGGDIYRPHMPEPYMHPGVPMRPGFFPAHVPYEGYYRPPMGFHNPNDRDFPFMGMPGGPPIYNRPTNPNTPDLNSSHPRSGEGRRPDNSDPGLLHDPRGNHNVLLKPNDGWNQKGEEKWGHRVTADGSNHEKGILSKVPLQENAWGDDHKTSKGIVYSGTAAKNEVPSRPHDNRFQSSSPAYSKLSESISNAEDPATNDLASSKDRSLIQKIEGLNANARTSGGSQSASSREELPEKVEVVGAWAHQSVDDAKTEVVLERHFPSGVLVPVSRDTNAEKSGDSSITNGARRSLLGAQKTGVRQGKGNFDGQQASGWGRKSLSQSVRSAGSNLTANSQVTDHNSPVQPFEVRKANIDMKGDGESSASDFDHNDTQRAKMREIAKQRAIQLQKEEEERAKEQKAKALAKLEELNRRSATQGVEVSSQKEVVQHHPSGPPKADDSRDQPDLKADPNVDSKAVLPIKIDHISENGPSKTLDSVATSKHSGAESKGNAQQDSASLQIQLETDNVHVEDAAVDTTQGRDTLKNKRAGYKPRDNVPPKKIFSQTSIVFGQIDVLIDSKGESATTKIILGSKADGEDGKELSETPIVSHPPATHKRRNNKNGKNKHKVEDSSNAVSGSPEDNASNLRPNSTSAQLSSDAKDPTQSSGENTSLPREDVHGRVNNSWKPQQSRKPRSSQGNRLSEKAQSSDAVVWAPVRPHNKVETTDLISQRAAESIVSAALGENTSQSSSKTKRAEMERYVPKSVAKEMAQQGSIQQSPTPEASQDSSSGNCTAKVGPVVESKNRQARGQGSWRQRTSQYSSAAISSTNDQPSVGQTVVSSESTMSKGPEVAVTDGWNTVDDSSSNSFAAATGVKDRLPSGRGKSNIFKGQRGSGFSRGFDHKDSSAVLSTSHFPEINHTEKTLTSKENGPVVDRSTPHWQPKSQGNRIQGGQNHMVEDSKQDIGQGSGTHSQSNHSAAKDPGQGSVDKAIHDMGHQEFKREKRGPYVKGRPHRPSSQGLEAGVEPALSDGADKHNEQQPSSGYHKNSNYGGRVNRAHESRGDWNTTAPERQRQNSHYEYQPVGPYNDDSGTQFENQHGGPKFRERGHSRRGRGNFHGRQSGNE